MLSLSLTPYFGNVLRVDSVYGNDANAALNNKLPFKTINAAMAAAIPDTAIWVFPGTYTESVVMKDDVSIIGLSAGGLIDGGVDRS